MQMSAIFQRAAAGVAAFALTLAILGSYFAEPAVRTVGMVVA